MITRILIIIIAIGFIGCSVDSGPTDYDVQLELDQSIIEEHLAANGKVAEKNDVGFYTIKLGENPNGADLEFGDIVSIYYTMSVLDGQTLHTVDVNTDPVQILFGAGLVRPQSLELALTEMKDGEVAEFYFPSGLAYVEYNYETLLPPNSIIKIIMEVVRVDDEASQKELEKARALQYIEDNNLENAVEKTDGLFYVQTEPGTGDPPAQFAVVTAHYTGTLLDGFKFDSSVDRDQPFSFQIGAGQVIEGWDEGFKDMTAGEKGILIIPSHMAYGVNFYTAPPDIIQDLFDRGFLSFYPFEIPPYSTLVFEVELISIE